jgi:hypothetical protein
VLLHLAVLHLDPPAVGVHADDLLASGPALVKVLLDPQRAGGEGVPLRHGPVVDVVAEEPREEALALRDRHEAKAGPLPPRLDRERGAAGEHPGVRDPHVDALAGAEGERRRVGGGRGGHDEQGGEEGDSP